MAINFSNLGSGVSSIFGGIGDFASASGDEAAAGAYNQAASLEETNAAIQKQSTAIQVQQATRQGLQVIGAQKAAVGGAGLKGSGSALDLLASSSQQANLQKQIVQQNGLIQENSFDIEAAAYKGQAQSAEAAGKAEDAKGAGGILGGVLGIFGL